MIFDPAPVGPYAEDWNPEGEEEAEIVEGLSEMILDAEHRRRTFHDQAGFYADEAGSAQCVALGHTDPEVSGDATDDEIDAWRESHPLGWHGSICLATRHGVACTTCEGECDNPDPADTADPWRWARAIR